MTDSVDKKVQIYIGDRVTESYRFQTCTAIVVDGKVKLNFKGTLDSPFKIIHRYAEIMKSGGYTDYDVHDGQRIRYTTSEVECCIPLGDNYIQSFRETLDAKLRE